MRSPPALLAVLTGTLLVALVFGATTTTAAFGAYNPAWDGASDLQAQADAVDSESKLAVNTSVYTAVDPNETVAVIITPDEQYGPRDIARVRQFVSSGGTLVVAEDFAPHSNPLMSGIGAETRFDGRLLRDERHYYRSPNITIATDVTRHPLTVGVDNLMLNHGTTLTNVDTVNQSEILVNTSAYAYLDGNRNSQLDDVESLQRRPVVAVEELGRGRIVAVSDPSLMINAMLERPGNRAFVRGLFASRNQVVLDYSHAQSLPPLSYAFVVVRGSGSLQAAIVLTLVALVGAVARYPGRVVGVLVPDESDSPVDKDAIVAQLRAEHPDWDTDRIERVASTRRWDERQ